MAHLKKYKAQMVILKKKKNDYNCDLYIQGFSKFEDHVNIPLDNFKIRMYIKYHQASAQVLSSTDISRTARWHHGN